MRVAPDAVEAIADVLREATGRGVVIEPPVLSLGPDEGYTLDEGAPAVLKAYIAGPATDARRRSLRRLVAGRGLDESVVGRWRWRTVAEEDWAEAWKAHYEVQHVGRVVVRPAWLSYEPRPDEVVVSLDPGMAFGTGEHPTTRMCLQALQDVLRPGVAVLDLGAGSGVLGIAAVALGAGRCVAVDTEPQAAHSTRANAALNDVTDRIEVVFGSIDALAGGKRFDLVLANINASTIVRLAAEIRQRLSVGGVAVAGGIVAGREDECAAALRDAGFAIESWMTEGDWRTLVARAD